MSLELLCKCVFVSFILCLLAPQTFLFQTLAPPPPHLLVGQSGWQNMMPHIMFVMLAFFFCRFYVLCVAVHFEFL